MKGWLRGKKRGEGRDDPSYPRWDFIKASPEGRKLVAPLFAAEHLREEGEEGRAPLVLPPVVMWPSQDVGDWIIRIRRLWPSGSIDLVWMDARYLAMLERRLADGSAQPGDEMRFRQHLADILEQAGGRQEAVLGDSGEEVSQYLDVETDSKTGKTGFQMKPLEAR